MTEPVKVSIETPPLTVRVEAPGTLDVVIKVTQALYRELLTPDMARPGGALGYTTERLGEEL